MEWEAKLRVPLLSVSDRSIHSDDNMMHPAETFLSMPAGNKFRKPWPTMQDSKNAKGSQ